MSLAASPDSSLGHGQAGPAIKVLQWWGPGVRLDAWERCCVSRDGSGAGSDGNMPARYGSGLDAPMGGSPWSGSAAEQQANVFYPKRPIPAVWCGLCLLSPGARTVL